MRGPNEDEKNEDEKNDKQDEDAASSEDNWAIPGIAATDTAPYPGADNA